MTKSVEDALSKISKTPPPDNQKFVSRTMNFHVELDPEALKKQELRLVRPFEQLAGSIPGELSGEAQIVMRALFDCFDRQKLVQEGILDDLLWGFEQCGIPARLTYQGLMGLHKHGYLDFTTLEHMPLPDPTMARSPKFVWVRYRKKLLNMVYSK